MRTPELNFSSFVNEFMKLSGFTDADAERVLQKMAAPVTQETAEKSLQRLQQLQESKPQASDLVRGSVIGSGVGTIASATNQLASGKAVDAFRTALKDRRPGWGGLASGIGKGALTMGKNMMGTAASSAVVGTMAPIAKRMADERAEMARIRGYLGEGAGGPVRQSITEYTGV